MKQKPIGFTPVSLCLFIYLKAVTHSFCSICNFHNLIFVKILKVTSSQCSFSFYGLCLSRCCSTLKRLAVSYVDDLCKFIWSLWGCCILWLLMYGKCIGTKLFITLSIGAGSLWSSTASLFKLSEEIFQQLLAHKQQLPP